MNLDPVCNNLFDEPQRTSQRSFPLLRQHSLLKFLYIKLSMTYAHKLNINGILPNQHPGLRRSCIRWCIYNTLRRSSRLWGNGLFRLALDGLLENLFTKLVYWIIVECSRVTIQMILSSRSTIFLKNCGKFSWLILITSDKNVKSLMLAMIEHNVESLDDHLVFGLQNGLFSTKAWKTATALDGCPCAVIKWSKIELSNLHLFAACAWVTPAEWSLIKVDEQNNTYLSRTWSAYQQGPTWTHFVRAYKMITKLQILTSEITIA